MANFRGPKYNFGLLETPDSSDLNSFSDATLLSTDGNLTMFSKTTNAKTSILGRRHLSKETSTTPLSSTLCASTELTETTTRNDDSPGVADVFQVPLGPAPKRASSMTWISKTPTNPFTPKTPSSNVRKRVEHMLSSSSVKSTPRRKDTPRGKSGETPGGQEHSVIVAIVEGRGIASGEIGMASIDLKNPVLILSQFSDSQTYVKTLTKLQILQPKEVVFPSTMCDNGKMTKVFKVVNENFQNCIVNSVQRRYFNEAEGLAAVKRLVRREHSSIEKDVTSKYYCLAACAALIRYVEIIQNSIYAPESLSIIFRGSEQTALIDSGTASALELLVNLENPKSNVTLYGVLNHTKTLGGSKLLRSNILQPPNGLETIQARLECVSELSDSSDLFFSLQSALGRFEIDIDLLLASLVQIPKQTTNKSIENHINTCILLKHVVELVPALEESIVEANCELLQAYKASLHDARFNQILEMLERVLHKEARYQKGHFNMKTQRCFAVKPDIDAILDLYRRSYTEYIDDTNELIQQLSEKHNLPLKSSYNASRGFHVQMPAPKNQASLPEEFIKVSKTNKTWSFTTSELVHLNDRIDNAMKDINVLSDSIVCKLLGEVRGSIGCLYNISEIVSTLDMLMSFAHVRTTTECVCPEFTDTLAVKQGRHPVLAGICANVISNNIYASEGSNFNIITGPNMSGKSTYLKMIALLQIMAQIGCFVPAEFASFRIADQIFSRVGSDDDINTNCSTFMTEMMEINYIIQNVSNNSLVIIDELGRGTSSEEGVGLCWAISEFLLSMKAFTFFATHFLELCKMEAVYPNVENYHFEIQHVVNKQGNLRKISFTYVLSRGFTKESHYGLELAELFNFPPSVMKRAREIAAKIEEEAKADDDVTSRQRIKDNATFKFATKLLQVARSSRLDEQALTDYLKSLKEEYLREIEPLQSEKPDSHLESDHTFNQVSEPSSATKLSDSRNNDGETGSSAESSDTPSTSNVIRLGSLLSVTSEQRQT